MVEGDQCSEVVLSVILQCRHHEESPRAGTENRFLEDTISWKGRYACGWEELRGGREGVARYCHGEGGMEMRETTSRQRAYGGEAR